jgi:hypothetical protein
VDQEMDTAADFNAEIVLTLINLQDLVGFSHCKMKGILEGIDLAEKTDTLR